jgi:hypothetical protein
VISLRVPLVPSPKSHIDRSGEEMVKVLGIGKPIRRVGPQPPHVSHAGRNSRHTSCNCLRIGPFDPPGNPEQSQPQPVGGSKPSQTRSTSFRGAGFWRLVEPWRRPPPGAISAAAVKVKRMRTLGQEKRTAPTQTMGHSRRAEPNDQRGTGRRIVPGVSRRQRGASCYAAAPTARRGC